MELTPDQEDARNLRKACTAASRAVAKFGAAVRRLRPGRGLTCAEVERRRRLRLRAKRANRYAERKRRGQANCRHWGSKPGAMHQQNPSAGRLAAIARGDLRADYGKAVAK